MGETTTIRKIQMLPAAAWPVPAGAVVTGVIPGKPKLLDQVRDAIRMRHMSVRTEEEYVH